jgi:hypothetical protein
MRLDVILRDTFTPGVDPAEVGLRGCVPLLGGLAIPLHRLGVVLRDTVAELVLHAHEGLCACIPLLRGFARCI